MYMAGLKAKARVVLVRPTINSCAEHSNFIRFSSSYIFIVVIYLVVVVGDVETMENMNLDKGGLKKGTRKEYGNCIFKRFTLH